MKIQIRIAILFTLICTFIIISLSVAVYYFAYEKAFEDFYVRLELRATIAAEASFTPDTSNAAAYEIVRNQHLQRLPQEREYIIPYDSLQQLATTRYKNEIPEKVYKDLIEKKDAALRIGDRFYKGIYYETAKGNYVIILSAVHSFARSFLSNLKRILVITNLISMVVIFIFGFVFSNRILKPIRRITKEVRNISATSLHNRLTIKDGKDEITELGLTFNEMISRLETAFETQNNFVSNASHELNTPLTAIIGEAELALMKPREPEDYQKSLQVVLSQAGKLKNITRSLLELAQSGFTGSLSFETVKVEELLRNVIKVSNSIYPNCSLVTDFSLLPADLSSITLKGNFHLLELCLSNILLNACKYSTGENVILAVAASDKHIIFIIKDKGIGIPEKDLPHIFDPFFRASNVKGSIGYGIGLPLSQNIIKLHKGEIQVASREDEGTEVVIRLPNVRTDRKA